MRTLHDAPHFRTVQLVAVFAYRDDTKNRFVQMVVTDHLKQKKFDESSPLPGLRPPREPIVSVQAQAPAEAAGTRTAWPHLHMSEKGRSQGFVYKSLQLLHLQKISKGL